MSSDAVERRIVDKASPDTERHLRDFIAALVEWGCRPELPPSQRDASLNIAPPPGHGRARVCCTYVSAARVEFQQDTYTIADEIGLGGAFDLVPAGNKAAQYLNTSGRVHAAVQLAKAVLAARRGT